MAARRKKADSAASEILLPYQKAWMEDKAEQKIWEKSRRIGASWIEALYSVLEAAASGGQNTYYISYDKDMTRQFVEDSAWWARLLGEAASDVQECIIQDEGKDITIFRINFDSGKEIVGMPSRPHVLRSKQGRVVFDEAAFSPEFDEVIKAAQALLIWGGQLIILSTHNGEDNPFNLLIKRIKDTDEGKYWSLHHTTFDDAIADGLYKKICMKRGLKWTAKGEKEFVAKIRGIYADNLDEELNVVPNRAGSKYFPRPLLDRRSADVPIVRLELSGDFLWEAADRKREKIRRWLMSEIYPILGAFSGHMFGGMDFARSGDLTIIWLAEETEQKTPALRLSIEIRNCPFKEQEQIVMSILDFCRQRNRLGGFAIDSRGNGQQLGETAMLEYPGAAVQVMLTTGIYAEWLPKLRTYLEENIFLIPDDEYTKADFGIVTLKNGVPVIPDVHTADRTGKAKRHGDSAVAAMLLIYAWLECSLDPAPIYVPVRKKKEKAFVW